jgi:hypothetical protein
MFRKFDLLEFVLVRYRGQGVVMIIGQDAENFGSVPVRADCGGQVDEPTANAGHSSTFAKRTRYFEQLGGR